MAVLYIDLIKPGMTLASEVRDINGRLLCNEGVEISEKHIKIFRTWGVTEADIKGIKEEDVTSMTEREVAHDRLVDAESELSEIFRYTDAGNPVMRELFNLCLLRKAGNGS